MLPFGADWLPVVTENLRPVCAASTTLLSILQDCRVSALPALLCALLSQDKGQIFLPSSYHCGIVLQICGIFEKAKASCPHARMFCCLPPTILGRIARSTSCTLTPNSCITEALFCACCCPSCLFVPGYVVGLFSGTDVSCHSQLPGRVVGFSSRISVPHFRTICELFLPANYATRLFLCINDCPQAAARSPLLLNELRAILFRCRRRRYVRQWLYPLDVVQQTMQMPASDVFQPAQQSVQQALLRSAFSCYQGFELWTTASECLKAWMDGVVSLRNWGTSQIDAWRKMFEASRFCVSASVQHVLSYASADTLTNKGFFVYALISPLWGKCYVGACGFRNCRSPLERWIEHVKQAKLWNSKTSQKRYASRRSPLYAAMAAVGPFNVIQVILAQPSRQDLASAERFFIRKLQPVFNIRETEDSVLHLARSLSTMVIDDVVTFGNRLLRHARPRLTPNQWASIIADVASAGDRVLAAKLARHARASNARASGLRALPQVVIPCAVPRRIISHVQDLLRNNLLKIPGCQRFPQFTIQLQVGRACWSKSPMADAIIAPSLPKCRLTASCACLGYSVNKVLDHVCLRQWQLLPCCAKLFMLVGSSTLAYRTFPPVDGVLNNIRAQAERKLRSCGLPKEPSEEIGSVMLQSLQQPFQSYWSTLPRQLLLKHIKDALIPIRKAGFIFVRIDRNPGRVVLLCQSLWNSLQRSTFLSSTRYCRVDLPPSKDDPDFSKVTVASFAAFVFQKCGERPRFRHSSHGCRPRGYFTIKQKSILLQTPAVIKVRPIISHFLHPCRPILRRVARALSILVSLATQAVRGSKPAHLPIWRMHQGVQHWLRLLSKKDGHVQLLEFDVEDCFLNTPRELVIPALRYWLDFEFARRRRTRFFAISKDAKSEDHTGRPCSSDFWEISSDLMLAVVEWELESNAFFEVLDGSGNMVVLCQEKGLPIGGHLSAALVELVALYREMLQPWPQELLPALTARYRDNFFAAVTSTADCHMEQTASSLTKLLSMPVKPVGRSNLARFLETTLAFDGNKGVRCTLAFRTDPDRQGESRDVQSWPPPFDPRAKMLLPGLVMGLASKLRFYSAPGVGGFTATVRRIYQFLKARGYPKRWWLRPLAVALVRVGVALPCLPPLLRKALSWTTYRKRGKS